jgi:hypothetical protein
MNTMLTFTNYSLTTRRHTTLWTGQAETGAGGDANTDEDPQSYLHDIAEH